MSLSFQKLAAAAALAFAAAAPLSASATVLTFDDISAASTGTVPKNYGGLTWSNASFLDTSAPEYEDTGFLNGTVSTDYIAYNPSIDAAHALTVSNGTAFHFSSVYLTSALNKNLKIAVEGYLHGALLFTKTVAVGPQAATAFKFDYDGIDNLKFVVDAGPDAADFGPQYSQFVMDNFAFTQKTTDVPEPATLGLMGLGLAGFAAARRKSKHSKNA